MAHFRGLRAGHAGTWAAEQCAFRVPSLNRLREGGHTAVSHSGPKGPKEWEVKYSAESQAGPCNQDTEGTSASPPRAGQEEMRGGGGHVPSKCPDVLGTGNYSYLTLP